MSLPEVPNLGLQIDQLDAVGESMMRMFDVLVMDAIAADKAGLNAMQQRLFDTRELGVLEQMVRHARARDAVPEPGRVAFGRVMKIKTQRNQLAHDEGEDG